MNIDEFRDEHMEKNDQPAFPVWKGKPVNELTREELIEAVVELYLIGKLDSLRYKKCLKRIREAFQ